jgi:hypothetical protein
MSEKLKELHEKLCEVLLEKIKSPDVTASELNVARQLLKDNGIDAVPVEGSPLQSLLDELPFKINDRNTKQAN